MVRSAVVSTSNTLSKPRRRNHFSFHVGADRHAEAFTQLGTDGRGSTYYNVFGRISQRCPNLVCVVLFGEGTGWTYCDTLTAVDTGCFVQRLIKGTADMCIIATVVRANHADELVLCADCHAAAAKNALGVVAYQMHGGIVDIRQNLFTAVLVFIYAEFTAKCLQFAVGGTGTGQAVLSVVGHEQFQSRLVGTLYYWRVSEHFHAFCYGVYTGSNQGAGSLYFDQTHTACADFIDFF